jgi:L-fuconolactonase
MEKDRTMFIADAQVHVWTAPTACRPWRPGWKAHREQPLEPSDVLHEMDEAGVMRAVLVPPYWEGQGNDLVLEAARTYPDRFAAIGRIDTAEALTPEVIADWRRQPGMLGFRSSFIRPPLTDALVNGDMEWLWQGAERAAIPLYLLVYHEHAHLIDKIAVDHPGLKIVVNHLGLDSAEKGAHAFRGLDKLLVLAKRPNVAVAASALPCYATDAYPYRSVQPYLQRVYDAFGPQRIFWGTDFQRLPCTYIQAVEMFTEEMRWLTSDDLSWIMGGGLCEWLGWPL